MNFNNFEWSESKSNIAMALISFQGEVLPIVKRASNPLYNSKYTPLPDIIEAVKPFMNNNGLCITQPPGGNDDNGRPIVVTVLLHSSGEYILGGLSLPPFPGREGKNPLTPHSMGSLITFCRRYSYLAMLGIADRDDDDGNSAHETLKNVEIEDMKSNPFEKLRIEAKEHAENSAKINGSLVSSITDLPYLSRVMNNPKTPEPVKLACFNQIEKLGASQ